jgi:hypothetical protein
MNTKYFMDYVRKKGLYLCPWCFMNVDGFSQDLEQALVSPCIEQYPGRTIMAVENKAIKYYLVSSKEKICHSN